MPHSPLVPPARTLVWARASDDDAPVTYVLSDEGEIVAQLPGIRIAGAGTEWRWEEAMLPVPTSPCDGAVEQPPGEGRGTRVRLVPSDGRHDPIALVAPPALEGQNEVDHTARLLASVGPYLFVEESTYAYSCGAHGNSEVRFSVWDLEEGTTLDLLSELPNRERLVAAAKSVLDEDVASATGGAEGGDGPSDGDDAPKLTELLPRVGPHGRLEASALVSIPSCYACTSGGWSSYTSSTPVPVDLPERLRRLGPTPAALQRFADKHPGLTIGGYSVIGAANPGLPPAARARVDRMAAAGNHR